MKKTVIWIIVAAFILLIGYRVVQRVGQRRASGLTEEKRRVPIRVMEVARGSMKEILSFTGDVKGKEQVNVYSEVPGRIRSYAVREGQSVKKNGLLATVDRAITGLEFEPAKIRSPIAGIVGRVFLDIGDAVTPQVPVALVVRMNTVEVTFSVVERDIPKVKTGLEASIKVDAHPDTIFQGKVTMVSPVVDPISRTSRAEITVDNRKGFLKPGMFARVDLTVREEKNTVVVPADAVLGRAERYVFLAEKGKAVRKSVSLGIRENNRVQVVEGLGAGDTLIVVGQRVVDDGEEVMIIVE